MEPIMQQAEPAGLWIPGRAMEPGQVGQRWLSQYGGLLALLLCVSLRGDGAGSCG